VSGVLARFVRGVLFALVEKVMTLDAFGLHLRRARLQRGIGLAQIAGATKIAEALLAGLEGNDFSEWPSGIYARAWVRQYAAAIGVDADRTVDEFCRYFPQADRRAESLLRELAEIYEHRLEWRDDDARQRRSTDRPAVEHSRPTAQPSSFFSRLRRVLPAPR
jgi:transcriptional regulator with XRE-family HTH domain